MQTKTIPTNKNKIGADLLNDERLTAFQREVFRLLLEVPRGFVTTYGRIATALGVKSAQAVGQALRHNPSAPQIPCHRVVLRTGELGGYGGDSTEVGVSKKQQMLRAEGVQFTPEGLIEPSCFYEFKMN